MVASYKASKFLKRLKRSLSDVMVSEVWVNVKDLLGINQEIKFLFKETEKVIGQTFDNNLSDKCYRLYESLVSKSFGI